MLESLFFIRCYFFDVCKKAACFFLGPDSSGNPCEPGFGSQDCNE